MFPSGRNKQVSHSLFHSETFHSDFMRLASFLQLIHSKVVFYLRMKQVSESFKLFFPKPYRIIAFCRRRQLFCYEAPAFFILYLLHRTNLFEKQLQDKLFVKLIVIFKVWKRKKKLFLSFQRVFWRLCFHWKISSSLIIIQRSNMSAEGPAWIITCSANSRNTHPLTQNSTYSHPSHFLRSFTRTKTQ